MRRFLKISMFAACLACASDPLEIEADDPCQPMDCEIASCSVNDDGVTCLFGLYVEDGNMADVSFQLDNGGDIDWNELPYNIDAGEFENAELRGHGHMCGSVSMSTEAIGKTITMVCTDWSAGWFMVSDPVKI